MNAQELADKYLAMPVREGLHAYPEWLTAEARKIVITARARALGYEYEDLPKECRA